MDQEEKDLEQQNQSAEQQPAAEQPQEQPAAEQPEQESPSKKERRKRHERHDDSAEKLQEMGEKLAKANDNYLRIFADFENYRKRTNLEKAELILNGGKGVIEAVLPVIDDMERALQSIADENAKEGVTLIYNKLMNILAQKGLKPMEAKGQKFDEMLHDAVAQIPAADESQKNTIIDVTQKGYYLNDKVLRFAKVVVAI